MKNSDEEKLEIMRQMNNLSNLVDYLKSKKHSTGLNSHDIKIYENAKQELVEAIKFLDEPRNYTISIKM